MSTDYMGAGVDSLEVFLNPVYHRHGVGIRGE
jgi:hypothetical protein